MSATFAAIAVSLAVLAPPTPWFRLSPAEKDQALEALRRRPLPERLLEASARFLDVPYVFSPLGEGQGKDADPTIRFDAVDCLSLVEETVAMSLAATSDLLEPLLQQIRYGPELSYEGRNHLMEAQWLPHAVALGIVEDVTKKYGHEGTIEARTVLTPESWQSPSSRSLELPPSRQPRGVYTFPLIPLARVLERLKDVPSGTLLVVVRDARPFKVTRMTHLGFVVQRKRTYLRHASKSRHGRVVDEDLEEFLTRNARYDKWPVTGVALYQVRPLPQGFVLSPPEASRTPPPPPPALPPPASPQASPLPPRGLPGHAPAGAPPPGSPTSPESDW